MVVGFLIKKVVVVVFLVLRLLTWDVKFVTCGSISYRGQLGVVGVWYGLGWVWWFWWHIQPGWPAGLRCTPVDSEILISKAKRFLKYPPLYLYLHSKLKVNGSEKFFYSVSDL